MVDYRVPIIATSEGVPARNEVLKFNGTAWVPATYDYDFAFAINWFKANASTGFTDLIGLGKVWKAAGDIAFTADYANGPPASAVVGIAGDFDGSAGSSGWTDDEFDMSDAPTSKVTGEDTEYPDDRGDTITFTLTADGEVDTVVVTFQNKIHWGSSAKNTGWSSAEILALNGSVVSGDHTRNSMSVTGLDAADYVVFACPAGYGNLSSVNFTYDGIIIAMTLETEALAVTNADDYIENYDVYVSDIQQPSGGNKTLRSDQSAAANLIFCGPHTDAQIDDSGILEIDDTADGESIASGTAVRTYTSIRIEAGEYLWICHPDRVSDMNTIKDGTTGFAIAGEYKNNVSHTNINGYTEDYRCWRSDNTGIYPDAGGEDVVVT